MVLYGHQTTKADAHFFISCPNWIWILRILSFFPYAKSQENCIHYEWLDSSIE